MAFRVPDDLADLDLTLREVREILDNRQAGKRIQTRLDNLPAKHEQLKAELATIIERETLLLQEAAERRQPAEAEAQPAQ